MHAIAGGEHININNIEMTKKILFINHEMMPYVPETEMSLAGRELPQFVQDLGYEVRTFMPKWGNINERRGQLHPVQRLSGMNIIIDETDQPLIIKVASIPQSRIQVYFIDNEDYFNRIHTTDDISEADSGDNGERAIFFARGVLDAVKKQRWVPDIIHCQGWISAVVPFYVKTAYKDEPAFANTKIITSLFKVEKDIYFGEKFKQSIPFREATANLLEGYKDDFDLIELAKFAIDYSDAVTVVSEQFNPELLDYVEKNGKQFLPYIQDRDSKAYSDFYHQMLGDE